MKFNRHNGRNKPQKAGKFAAKIHNFLADAAYFCKIGSCLNL